MRQEEMTSLLVHVVGFGEGKVEEVLAPVEVCNNFSSRVVIVEREARV